MLKIINNHENSDYLRKEIEVTYELLTHYQPISVSNHVASKESNKNKIAFIKENWGRNIQVFDNVNKDNQEYINSEVKRPESLLFVFPNGLHAIINKEGNIVSIVPLSLLTKKKMSYVRCNCKHCQELNQVNVVRRTHKKD